MAVSVEQQPSIDAATAWRIDSAASRIEFTARTHLPFASRLPIGGQTVVGRFAAVSGSIVLEERRPATAQVEIVIDTASVDTQQQRRDTHLRSADFFDVAQFPTMTFASRMVEPLDRPGGLFRVMGDLTLRGVTRAVRLNVHLVREQSGTGQPQMTVTATTVLNRADYGLQWNSLLLRVADDVAVNLVLAAHPVPVGAGA